MNPQEYIEDELNKLKIKSKFMEFNSKEDLVEFIFKNVISKKFRKYSVNPDYLIKIKSILKDSVELNKPISFVMSFGGYKLWRFEEFPEVDWAEFFAFLYYINYLKPIAEIYKPGVILNFHAHSKFTKEINNFSDLEIKKYLDSFNNLLIFLKNYLPENIKLNLINMDSHFSMKEIKDILSNVENGDLPILTNQKKQTIEMNVRLKENQDQDILWKEKIEAMYQEYNKLNHERIYSKINNEIFISCIKKDSSITLGTTKTSIVKFWVGVGILKEKANEYIEYVFSLSQIKDKNFNILPIKINGLSGKNFKNIKIFK